MAAYISDWLTLAEAVSRLEAAGEAAPAAPVAPVAPVAPGEALRRACADGRVRGRGVVEGAMRELGAEWWHPGAVIDAAAGRVARGPATRRLPTRALADEDDPLGPDDWRDVPVRGNVAEAVEVNRADLDRAFGAPGEGEGSPPPSAPSAPSPPSSRAAGRYSPAALEAWYAERIAACEAEGRMPSRAEDWEAAREALGAAVPRDAVWALRRRLAPESWKKRGRRR